MVNNLQIGACGWSHPDWEGHFYPEDLPEAWQLDYYSNAFRVVLVPEEQWMAWSEEQVEECRDSVEGDFLFYLAINDNLSSDKAKQLKKIHAALNDNLGGVVVFSDQWVPDLEIEGVPFSLVSSECKMVGWSWECEGQKLSGAPFGWVTELSKDGKKQAELLRSFMSSLPVNQGGAPFFIGGESINMTQVSNLKTVGEFLGY